MSAKGSSGQQPVIIIKKKGHGHHGHHGHHRNKSFGRMLFSS